MSISHGDYSKLASYYPNRGGYSIEILHQVGTEIGAFKNNYIVADVGAGTGKLTEDLIQVGLRGFSIEPNEQMFEEGKKNLSNRNQFKWLKGSAENIPLPNRSVNWVLMGSSFHWTNPSASMKEFKRILKPGGHFTALWNPRDISQSSIEQKVDLFIKDLIPGMTRVSSGNGKFTDNLPKLLESSKIFRNVVYHEGFHEVLMEPERYVGAWKSVNDIQVQSGEEKFNKIIGYIEDCIKEVEKIPVYYKTRSWTAELIENE